MTGSKARMTGRMPVLREHDVVEALDQRIDRVHYLVTARQRRARRRGKSRSARRPRSTRYREHCGADSSLPFPAVRIAKRMGRPPRDQSARACQNARRKAATAVPDRCQRSCWRELGGAGVRAWQRARLRDAPSDGILSFRGQHRRCRVICPDRACATEDHRTAAAAQVPIGKLPQVSPVQTSWASFLFLAFLLAAGLFGSRDPLENPLPLTIWTLWWVGLTLLQAIVGNLWVFLTPWTGPYRLIHWLSGARVGRLAYPTWLGYWPAVVLFFAFAWLELVYPAPDDPERLAFVVGAYWLVAFLGMLVFGEKAWSERAEPFSIFFRLVAGLSPLHSRAPDRGKVELVLRWPGASLLAARAAARLRRALRPSDALLGLLRWAVANVLVAGARRHQSARISRPERGRGSQHVRAVPRLCHPLGILLAGGAARLDLGWHADALGGGARNVRLLNHPDLDCLPFLALPDRTHGQRSACADRRLRSVRHGAATFSVLRKRT